MSGGGGSGQDADRSEEEESSPTPQEQEAMLKKKYGGLIPKKPPLISKDHERAFFDSADWALGKGDSKNEQTNVLNQELKRAMNLREHFEESIHARERHRQGAPPNPLLGGSKPRSSMEALRPKLQPTPHQPLPARRSSYVPPDGEEGEPGATPEGEATPN